MGDLRLKIKKYICAVLTGWFVLILTFSGCGQVVTEEQILEDIANHPVEKVYLEFYNRKREVYELMESIIHDFNASQDRIVVTQIMNTNAEVPLRVAATDGDFPDMVLLSGLQSTETTEYIIGGHMLALDDMECLDRISKDYLPSLIYDGHIYQLPMAMGCEGIYVNTRLFEEEGLEIPTTYEELCSVCEEIMSRGKIPFIFADAEGWAVHQNWECIQSVYTDDFGSLYSNVAEGKTTFWEQDITREAMKKLIELHQYTSEAYVDLNYDEAINRFAEEKAFMFMQGSWAYRNIIKQNPHIELEMIPFPVEEGQEQNFTIWVDSSVGIFKNCEHPEEAKEFLNYLMSPSVLQTYLDEEKIMGCVRGSSVYVDYSPRISALISARKVNLDATWIPSQTSVIRDEDIASLMPDATDEEVKKYMDVLTQSLQKHSEQFLQVKEKTG